MLSFFKVNQFKQLVLLGLTVSFSGCSVLGIGYNNFLCQEQDEKHKCVSASTFLEKDEQAAQSTAQNVISSQPSVSKETTVAVYESSGNLVDDAKPKIHYYHPNLLNGTSSYDNNPAEMDVAQEQMPTVLAVNGVNQPIDQNNFLVTGYYAFPYLQYPKVADNNYLVIWVAPVRLQGKVMPPRFYTIPYIH